MEVRAIPQGMHGVTLRIVVRDATLAAEWYPSALGAEEHDRLELLGGKLLYVELWFSDSAVRVADEFPEARVLSPQSIGGTPVLLHLFTNDVAASGSGPSMRAPRFSIYSRISSGATEGQLTDPFGHRWNLAQHVRDVPREEIARTAASGLSARERRPGRASRRGGDARDYR